MQFQERDLDIGHPSAIDTVIGSDEHKAWLLKHQFSENARDFPPGHPKAIDTKGNMNHLAWRAGVDPLNPHLEPHTGLTPVRAKAVATWNKAEAMGAHESPALVPVDATVANAALAEKRKELGVDALDAAQTSQVLETVQEPVTTATPQAK